MVAQRLGVLQARIQFSAAPPCWATWQSCLIAQPVEPGARQHVCRLLYTCSAMIDSVSLHPRRLLLIIWFPVQQGRGSCRSGQRRDSS